MGRSLRLVVLGALLISLGFSASAVFPRDHDYEYEVSPGIEATHPGEPDRVPYENLTTEEQEIFDALLERGTIVREAEPHGGHLLATTDTGGYGGNMVPVVFENRTYTVTGWEQRTNYDERILTTFLGLYGGGAITLVGLFLGLAGRIRRL